MSFLRRLFGGSKPAASAAVPLDTTRSVVDLEAYEQAIEALEEPTRRVYSGQAPFHYGVSIYFEDGGPDPLNGVSIFWNASGPHWHYVSIGLARFGCGMELTLRLEARADEIGTEPEKFLGSIAYQAPKWPITVMNMLARRILRTKRPFLAGEWWQGPPNASPEFLVFSDDPELGHVSTAVGRVAYIQATVAVAETIEAMKRDELAARGDAELDRLRKTNPLLVSARNLVRS
ncbi:MAG: suppressor of fused domain protein [Kofleriaceae bacterium]